MDNSQNLVMDYGWFGGWVMDLWIIGLWVVEVLVYHP